jgi:hypothetical protein
MQAIEDGRGDKSKEKMIKLEKYRTVEVVGGQEAIFDFCAMAHKRLGENFHFIMILLC